MAAESPSPPPSSPPPAAMAAAQYWCYHCDKRVSVETLPGQPDDVICNECKFGFVESIPTTSSTTNAAAILSPSPSPSDHMDEGTLGNTFLQVLRLLAEVSREDLAPRPPPPPPQARPLNPADPSPADESDFLRIVIDGWDEDEESNNRNVNREDEDDDDEEEDDDDDEDVRSVEIEGQSDDDEEEREEDIRRRRRDVLRLRLRDFANRARSEGRNRILDWAEILMGLEDNSIEFRFEMPETTDRYIGHPLDYVDEAEYEALLQNLADAEGRRGAPPAAKGAVECLKVVEIKTVDESYVCAICKDGVNVGEFVKEMPCGHGYHGDCIVPWLEARNSCPVCRFELPTDDAEYEEDRKKRFPAFPGSSSGSAGGNSV
ncbi:E3 ubiquitin-protein ligase CIP8-like [Chenopodium quinoa]|uniref:E3 ubiquitin-protein ligase CIP8-like n=1 Tax=Chenopodium quinoa TaxID=63459 RepID=UPI000B77B678|nr:E3 ubiquitin-protein ligase CIP8-like [Chenopodium quinoa]XP_021755297.1 E3 ubiquitin-protein ligase CIP8-like [Chenopodium quinoa]